jgi:hypothetical protein
MINELTALKFKQELHPSYAGYLHDGAISNRDQLAAIFALVDYGSIEFIYKHGNVNQPVENIRRTSVKPRYEFENKILGTIFEKETVMPVYKIEYLIKNQQIKNILIENIDAIKNLNLNENNLKFGDKKNFKSTFTVNGVEINSLEKANQAKAMIAAGSFIFIAIGGFMLLSSIITGNFSAMDFMSVSFIFTGLIMGYSFFYGSKYVEFDLPSHVEDYKKKYLDLYEFLKARPLDRRKLSDEFLAYDIAFGLNNHWTKEFEISEDFKIDNGKFAETSK